MRGVPSHFKGTNWDAIEAVSRHLRDLIANDAESARFRQILRIQRLQQEPFLANGMDSHSQQQEEAFLGNLPKSLTSKVEEEKPDNGSIPRGEWQQQ
ncbi:hypothetical protein KFK09_027184 [Dendrobium nobile]|uniref:Uncharacterized protein n=1 Tax=Dendrobium nobile TaxID=94219 RepID=A0A8T3A9U4_DENNO|nr:hypothetical protein KFK09_027184 [Dendrobium nobile]